jgi:UDP-galactopyranose mutase
MRSPASSITLVCFSHLRWHFVYQRPQHLISRAAQNHTVYFVEEPVPAEGDPGLAITRDPSGVFVVTPQVRQGQDCRNMLEVLFAGIAGEVITWFYTPMALPLADSLSPSVTIFDCMDELSAFKFASPELKVAERRLLDAADVVFTGGQSLYEAKRNLHPNVHCFPSSVDAAHFGRARRLNVEDPVDQRHILGPSLGFFGVIDERFDCELLEGIAGLRPEWSFVMIGPVVKIDPASLPQRANIHWLGGRDYKYLPQYLAHWDCGIMPFAINVCIGLREGNGASARAAPREGGRLPAEHVVGQDLGWDAQADRSLSCARSRACVARAHHTRARGDQCRRLTG